MKENNPIKIYLLSQYVGFALALAFVAYLALPAVFDFVNEGFSAETANQFIMLEQSLFLSVPFLILISAFQKSFGYFTYLISLLLGYLSNEFEIFTDHVHSFLLSNSIYPDSWVAQDGTANVQYAVLSFYIFSICAFVIVRMIKRSMSIAHYFVILGTIVALGTTVLFHILIVQSSLSQNMQESRNENMSIIEVIMDVEPDAFADTCTENGFNCSVYDERSDLQDVLNEQVPLYAENALRTLELDSLRVNPIGRYTFSGEIGLLDTDVRGKQFGIGIDKNGMYRFVYDDKSYNHIVWRHKIYFATLVVVAHLWWFFGLTTLLQFHYSRFRKRSAHSS